MKKSSKTLQGKRVAILACEGFEEIELTSPRQALEEMGAETLIISPTAKKIKSWRHDKWGKFFKVDKNLSQVNPKDFDALLLPGGVMNPDKLRTNKDAVKFVNYFMEKNKPIAAICHAPWTLIETKKLSKRKMTSYHSIKTDLINAGAKWQNKRAVIDKNLLTSRNPDDLPAFNKAMIKLFQ